MKILSEFELRAKAEEFTSCIEKGYPEIVTPLTYVTISKGDEILIYSAFSDMGDFYFVGNTYVFRHSRGKGLYSKLLSLRNQLLDDKPKVTLVNPIEGTNIEILEEQVAKQGGVKVRAYSDVADIMTEETYIILAKLPIYIYR